MRRYPSRGPTSSSFSFGPGPLSPAIKALIAVNVAVFLVMWLMPSGVRHATQEFLGLLPTAIFESFRVWQPVTYMFLHDTQAFGHILFNMLALWMFGTELERMWGTNAFLRYYFATGIAAAITTILVSLMPFPSTVPLFHTVTIGASGAIYGLLLAYGLTFPNRPIYIYFIFAIPAKYFVMIMGAIALLSSMGGTSGGIAHITHLGGLLAGFVMLRGRRLSPANEVRYRYLRWKMDRARKKFGVYSGGKKDWDRHIH
jgi:membrane associated rhomboid family serine protease